MRCWLRSTGSRAAGNSVTALDSLGGDGQYRGWSAVVPSIGQPGISQFRSLWTDHRDVFRRASRQLCSSDHGPRYECGSHSHSFGSEKPEQWERQQADLVAWLHGLPKPTAVLACTDNWASGCSMPVCERRSPCPTKVAVMGVENEETLCEMSSPPLTSLRLAGEQVGYEAAKLLDRLMRGRKAPRKPILVAPLGIVTRKSTDTVAIAEPLLAQAIRLIRQRAHSGLRVNDV